MLGAYQRNERERERERGRERGREGGRESVCACEGVCRPGASWQGILILAVGYITNGPLGGSKSNSHLSSLRL